MAIINFDSYASTNSTKYIYSDNNNKNVNEVNKNGKNLKIGTFNSTASNDTFRYRSFLLANDYQNSGLVAGEQYIILFDLYLNQNFDISNFTIN